MDNLIFEVDKMYKLPDCGTLKAFADIKCNDAMVIKGIRVLSGKKGLFVSLPQEQGKDSKWYDQVVFTSTTAYERLSDVVLKHYDGKERGAICCQ